MTELSNRIKALIRDIPDYPKKGIVFKDITPVLLDINVTMDAVRALADPFRGEGVDRVVGIEARGFILGAMLAHELRCSFVPMRKAGKLPYQTRRQRYDLEYGSAEIEVHTDALATGNKVLIHDDLLATGGTACAAASLVKSFGATLAGFTFLVNLSFLSGAKLIAGEFGMEPEFIVKY